MADWLQPVAEALSARKGRLRWFCRDDDGGWGDPELLALMNTCEAARAPLDIAVIPQALGSAAGAMLAERIGPRLGCHQHGYAHVDHARSGRRCEFGPDRSPDQQRADLQRGMELLGRRTLGRADPIFTPPWNRCTQVTADALASMESASGATSLEMTSPPGTGAGPEPLWFSLSAIDVIVWLPVLVTT